MGLWHTYRSLTAGYACPGMNLGLRDERRDFHSPNPCASVALHAMREAPYTPEGLAKICGCSKQSFRGSHVYFIRCGDFVKVGVAKRLHARFSCLQLSTPHDIALLTALPGDCTLEKMMHAQFAAHHHRGEWFRLEGTLKTFLKKRGVDV
jgi:hypothetical protein